jgi:hypothetical protein
MLRIKGVYSKGFHHRDEFQVVDLAVFVDIDAFN